MNKKTKLWLIVAASFILIGSIIFAAVMSALKWDFRKLSTFNYERNEHRISGEYTNVSVRTMNADVAFLPYDGGKTIVVCYEREDMTHNVYVNDGTLYIELKDDIRWYEMIGINFDSESITVYLPEREYGKITVKSSTSDLSLKNLNIEALDISLTTGDVEMSSIKAKSDVNIKVTTGDIELKSVIAEGDLYLKSSTGDIELSGCDASSLDIKTTTGDLEGSLLSSKVFIAKATTGSIKVPESVSGGICRITTTTGDIEISYVS